MLLRSFCFLKQKTAYEMRISGWSSGVCSSDLDVIQRHLVAGLSGQLLDDDLVSGGDAILLAARAHDCEHGSSLLVQICFTQIVEGQCPVGPARECGPLLE